MLDSSMIIVILLAIVSVILILSIVHISGKVDEIARIAKEILILEEQKNKNRK